MVADIDADGNAQIEFEEFVAMMGDKVVRLRPTLPLSEPSNCSLSSRAEDQQPKLAKLCATQWNLIVSSSVSPMLLFCSC